MSELFARALAEADSKAQADFFNEFATHLRVVCRGKEESQICEMSYDCKQAFVEFCSSIVGFNELHDKDHIALGQKLRSLREQERKLQQEIEERQRQLEEVNNE